MARQLSVLDLNQLTRHQMPLSKASDNSHLKVLMFLALHSNISPKLQVLEVSANSHLSLCKTLVVLDSYPKL